MVESLSCGSFKSRPVLKNHAFILNGRLPLLYISSFFWQRRRLRGEKKLINQQKLHHAYRVRHGTSFNKKPNLVKMINLAHFSSQMCFPFKKKEHKNQILKWKSKLLCTHSFQIHKLITTMEEEVKWKSERLDMWRRAEIKESDLA